MPANHQSYIEIDEAINTYLVESEQSNHKYFKLWHLCFDGMNQLGLDFFYRVQSVKLPINANMTVNLPADYLNYSKLGVFNSGGEIIPLGYNSNLTTAFDLQPTRLEQTQDPTLINTNWGINPTWYNYWNGGEYSNLYGLPSGAPFIGSFKIDSANGVILLNECFGYSYVALEYVASPTDGQSYRIPVQFKEALVAYLRWKDVISVPLGNRRGAIPEKQMRRHEFFNERRLAIARWKPVYLQEGYNANLLAQRLTVKV